MSNGEILEERSCTFLFSGDSRSSSGRCAVMESVGVTQILQGRTGRVPPLSLPGCHLGAAGVWIFGIALHLPHEAKDSRGCLLILPPWPSTAALACQERLVGKKSQPSSSSPSGLSAEGKAKLSLGILLFILLGFSSQERWGLRSPVSVAEVRLQIRAPSGRWSWFICCLILPYF